MSQSILAISYFFHLIATIIWIGGLVIMVILVWPELRRNLTGNPALFTMLTRLRQRFFPMTYLSLAVLIVTGLIQMTGDSNYEGVLQFTNQWSQVILLKHIAIGGMFICGMVMQFWVMPALERTTLLIERGKGDPSEWDKLCRSEVRLTWINVILGIVVLGFTAWATAI